VHRRWVGGKFHRQIFPHREQAIIFRRTALRRVFNLDDQVKVAAAAVARASTGSLVNNSFGSPGSPALAKLQT
jgi:hypothetical protein